MSAFTEEFSNTLAPYYAAPIQSTAPTAASTSNGLTSAAGGLESLLQLAVQGYTGVLSAKAAVTTAKTQLANANKTGVNTTPTAPAADTSMFSPKVVLIGAGVIAAGILGVVLLRK